MRVVVTGGTGFLGTALVRALGADSHDVTVLTRDRPRRPGEVQWDPARPDGSWAGSVEGAGAVINLAGEPIAAGRWTASRKRAILSSRIDATRAIVHSMHAGAAPPAVLLSGSAIGYYGTPGDRSLDESSPPGTDFLADACRQWEHEARLAEGRARVVLLRTGIVLGPGGGALEPLARPFRFFAGGPIGSGRQVMSWIHRDDWVTLVRWALANEAISGPLNLTAPHPVTSREMASALGRALNRPSFLPAPAFAVKLLLGEMADTAILNGQRVLPAVATSHGFRFRYETIDAALGAIYGRGKRGRQGEQGGENPGQI